MVRPTVFSSAALAAVVFSQSAQAFNISPRSSFVGRPTSFAPRSTVRKTSTSLSMNLFDRFQRVAKSNINNVLKNLEDPEKIMNQAVEDMQGDLVKVRQSYAEVTATQRRLVKQKEAADALAEDWYGRAQLALQKNNDQLAKEALTRRQQQVDISNDLQSQLDAQATSIDKLYEGMQALESKIMEAKAKKDQLVARTRTAESTQKVNDMMSGISGKTSMDAFNRMEDKVEALEASAEVSAEMGALSGNALPGGSDLEKEFKMLESGDAVDDELKRMKGLLGGASDGGSGGSKSSVDDELERLKRDAGL